MLAGSLQIPELEINNAEANKLGQAIVNVSAFYPTKISREMQAWTALFMIAGGLYGSRYVAYNARIAAEKKQPPPTRVVDMGLPNAMTTAMPMHGVNGAPLQ